MKIFKKIPNVPNLLTLSRIFFSLTLLPFLMYYILPLHNFWLSKVLMIVCFLLSLTDFFDGYLARKYHQETKLGKWLDPIADKVFVGSVLATLALLGRISSTWAFMIMAREVIVTFFRWIGKSRGFAVPVFFIGRLKTTFQYTYIMYVVGVPWGISTDLEASVGILIFTAMGLTSLISGIVYSVYFAHQWYIHSRK